MSNARPKGRKALGKQAAHKWCVRMLGGAGKRYGRAIRRGIERSTRQFSRRLIREQLSTME